MSAITTVLWPGCKADVGDDLLNGGTLADKLRKDSCDFCLYRIKRLIHSATFHDLSRTGGTMLQ